MINLINFLLLGAGMAPIAPNAAPDAPVEPSAIPSVSPIDMVPGYEGAFLKMFLALIALIVGIFFTVWLLKKLSQGRWAGGNSSRAIKIIEKRPLSPKTMLYIIDVDGQQSVIAESQLEIKHLMNLEDFNEEPNK
jgi:flagellar biogenesis protein FliO